MHADLTLDPDVLVDVATLTGAATLALGRTHAALFTPGRQAGRRLLRAGERSANGCGGCPSWRTTTRRSTPTIADVHHVAGDGFVGGGAITAALFLQRFVGQRRWAHLDVAGPARASSASHEVPEGATGFGVRALLAWLAGDL